MLLCSGTDTWPICYTESDNEISSINLYIKFLDQNSTESLFNIVSEAELLSIKVSIYEAWSLKYYYTIIFFGL